MRGIIVSISLLLSSSVLSSIPDLPTYEPIEEYSAVDRVLEGGKVVIKGALSTWAFISALEHLESCFDQMPLACRTVQEERSRKERYQPQAYAVANTYVTHMPRQFARPFINLIVGSALLYISARLAKSAWRNFKQATQLSLEVQQSYASTSRIIRA